MYRCIYDDRYIGYFSDIQLLISTIASKLREHGNRDAKYTAYVCSYIKVVSYIIVPPRNYQHTLAEASIYDISDSTSFIEQLQRIIGKKCTIINANVKTHYLEDYDFYTVERNKLHPI